MSAVGLIRALDGFALAENYIFVWRDTRVRTFFIYIVLSLAFALPPNQMAQAIDIPPYKCSQPVTEQTALIREAETNQYTVRRVEFIGNRYTRDAVLRRRINVLLQEGELFTREKLIISLRNVSRLKVIYPVRLSDVEIRLDKSGKMIDVTICFRERRRASNVQRRNPKRAV
jgi:hypothetical protein